MPFPTKGTLGTVEADLEPLCSKLAVLNRAMLGTQELKRSLPVDILIYGSARAGIEKKACLVIY
jgi:hypothetical protein